MLMLPGHAARHRPSTACWTRCSSGPASQRSVARARVRRIGAGNRQGDVVTSIEPGSGWSERLNPRNWTPDLEAGGRSAWCRPCSRSALGVLRIADDAEQAAELGRSSRLRRGPGAGRRRGQRAAPGARRVRAVRGRRAHRRPRRRCEVGVRPGRRRDRRDASTRCAAPAELDPARSPPLQRSRGRLAGSPSCAQRHRQRRRSPSDEVVDPYTEIIEPIDVLRPGAAAPAAHPGHRGPGRRAHRRDRRDRAARPASTRCSARRSAPAGCCPATRPLVDAADARLRRRLPRLPGRAHPRAADRVRRVPRRRGQLPARAAARPRILAAPAGPDRHPGRGLGRRLRRLRAAADRHRGPACARELVDAPAPRPQDQASNLAGINSVILLLGLLIGITIAVLVARALVRSLRVLRTLRAGRRRAPAAAGRREHARRRTPDITVEPVPVHRPRGGRPGGPGVRRGARARRSGWPPSRRPCRPASAHVRQPVPAQPGAGRAAAAADRAAGEQRAGPRPAVQPVPARPPGHPDAAQQREPAGPRGHRRGQAERGARSRWSTCCAPRCPRSSSTSAIVVQPPPTATILGRAARDLVHLLAELLDNATNFSPPDSQVVMSSTRTADGVDRGGDRRPRRRDDRRRAGRRERPAGRPGLGRRLRRPAGWACSWSAGWPPGTASSVRLSSSGRGRSGSGLTASVTVPTKLVPTSEPRRQRDLAGTGMARPARRSGRRRDAHRRATACPAGPAAPSPTGATRPTVRAGPADRPGSDEPGAAPAANGSVQRAADPPARLQPARDRGDRRFDRRPARVGRRRRPPSDQPGPSAGPRCGPLDRPGRPRTGRRTGRTGERRTGPPPPDQRRRSRAGGRARGAERPVPRSPAADRSGPRRPARRPAGGRARCRGRPSDRPDPDASRRPPPSGSPRLRPDRPRSPRPRGRAVETAARAAAPTRQTGRPSRSGRSPTGDRRRTDRTDQTDPAAAESVDRTDSKPAVAPTEDRGPGPRTDPTPVVDRPGNRCRSDRPSPPAPPAPSRNGGPGRPGSDRPAPAAAAPAAGCSPPGVPARRARPGGRPGPRFDPNETTPIFEEIASAWFRSNRSVPVAVRPGPGPAAPAARPARAPRRPRPRPPALPPARRPHPRPGAAAGRRRTGAARTGPARTTASPAWPTRAGGPRAAWRPTRGDELTPAGLPKRRPRARLVPGSAGSAVLAPPADAVPQRRKRARPAGQLPAGRPEGS